MKNLLIVLSVLILSACTTNPPIIEFIDIPEELLVDQGDLIKISEKTNLESLGMVIDENYKKYHITRDQILKIKKYQDKVKADASKKN